MVQFAFSSHHFTSLSTQPIEYSVINKDIYLLHNSMILQCDCKLLRKNFSVGAIILIGVLITYMLISNNNSDIDKQCCLSSYFNVQIFT